MFCVSVENTRRVGKGWFVRGNPNPYFRTGAKARLQLRPYGPRDTLFLY